MNNGCSTNVVTYFFVFFVPALLTGSLLLSVWAGFCGMLLCSIANRYRPRWVRPLFFISAWLQTYVTTKEPERLHLETAIRSYQMLEHCMNQQHALSVEDR